MFTMASGEEDRTYASAASKEKSETIKLSPKAKLLTLSGDTLEKVENLSWMRGRLRLSHPRKMLK